MDPTQMPVAVEGSALPPVQGAVPVGAQPISEEQKQSLIDMINQIRQNLGSFNAVKFASGNKMEKLRQDLLKQVFEKLQMAGVDLTDKQSVAEFIARLREESPELADMFEKSMDVLLGGEEGFSGVPQDPTASMDLGVPPINNMNNINPNEALPQTQ